MGSVYWLHITVLYLENTNIFTENSKSDGLTNSEFWFVKKKMIFTGNLLCQT